MKFIGYLLGGVGVIMASLGAHIYPAPAFTQAAYMQILHSLLLLYLTHQKKLTDRIASYLILLGILLFCGTIYVKYVFALPGFTRWAPFGGMAWIMGWILAAGGNLQFSKK
ncbi:MAG: DUF423 domain-containing protein [Bacteroidia bacterium]